MVRRIYLDHNATTPLAAEVRTAMTGAMERVWGNPSSTHAVGRAARDAVERARRDVAALLGAAADEVVFTSGGTEANNLAIRGLAHAARGRRGGAHVVSSRLEHPSVAGALAALSREGFTVSYVAVGPQGEITAEALRAALREDTVLVSLATANHELGNLYDVAALAAVARAHGALFHTDAVQAAGRVPLDVAATNVDAATVSAHKVYGPKGVGGLFVRRGLDLEPLVAGGHQEHERRPGTENVVGIVGFGAASRLARVAVGGDPARIAPLRDRLEAKLLQLPGARLHGARDRRVPGTTNVAFAGAPGELVMINLDLEGVCVSTGAACTSGSVEPSPVLLALGLAPERAREGVRFSLGGETTAAEVDRAAALTASVVERVRAAAVP